MSVINRASCRVTVLAMVVAAGCSPGPMSDAELVSALETFELSIEGLPRAAVEKKLREQAEEFSGKRVKVESAVVASTYLRDNETHLYFGVNYDRREHLFLSEIDPALHEALLHHRHWASVVKTYSSRQLSYELPVDEAAFNRLEQGEEVSIVFSVASLIRGKSVYCSPVDLKIVFRSHSNPS